MFVVEWVSFITGKKIVAQFIAETTYHIKFPAALAAVVPLKPNM